MASGQCKDKVVHFNYCHSYGHDTMVCRELNSGCDFCSYRGHKKTGHACTPEGIPILDQDGKPTPRDIDRDFDRFRRFADSGYYTRKRECYPGYGFWLLPLSLRGKVSGLRYSKLYSRGCEEARRRIRDIASGKVDVAKYGECATLALPSTKRFASDSGIDSRSAKN